MILIIVPLRFRHFNMCNLFRRHSSSNIWRFCCTFGFSPIEHRMAFYIAAYLPSFLDELNSAATMGSHFVWSLQRDWSHQWRHLFSIALRSQIPSILHAPCIQSGHTTSESTPSALKKYKFHFSRSQTILALTEFI